MEKIHDKIVLLTKSKLNGIEVLISKPLIDSVISHDEFVLINNIYIYIYIYIYMYKYEEIKEEIKNSNNK